jgi:ferric-dicitrate binding protein FerR (iron transport regulator)
MNRDDDKTNGMMHPTPEEQQALEALMSLPRPHPSAQAREKARAAFLGEEGTERDKPVRTIPRRRSQRWLSIPLAAAVAAVLLALFWYGNQPLGSWIITDVVAPAGIEAKTTQITRGAMVQAGQVLTGEGSELELQFGRELRFRMLPASRLQLPSPPTRWFGRSRTLTLEAGEIYGTTGGRSLSFPLLFETAEVTAQLTGTTFAVFRTDVGTCVCLWSGAVEVVPRDTGEAVTLTPETKYYVYNDGRPSEVQPIDAMERMKLSMMHDSGIVPTPEIE